MKLDRRLTVFFFLAMTTVPLRADLIEDPAEDASHASSSQKPAGPATGLIHEDSPTKVSPNVKPKPDTVPTTKSVSESKPSGSDTKRLDKGDRNRNPDAPINFEGDNLSGDRDGGTIILEKNVVVTQDDLKIKADKATLKFERLTNEVIEVIAEGNVQFFRRDPETGQPVTATSREAVFNNAARTVILKGDPKMVRGTDVVRGKQITYDLTTGWMKATRVEGVVQPTKNDKNKPQASTKPIPTPTSSEAPTIEKGATKNEP